jgi:hypothetical protein
VVNGNLRQFPAVQTDEHEKHGRSVLYLVPKPPAKNVMKLLQNEKKRLRFRARFTDPKDAADEQRRFIITYFTADDTISVYEESINNSGRWSGKFLERGRVLKPDPTRGSAAVVYYGIEVRPHKGREGTQEDRRMMGGRGTFVCVCLSVCLCAYVFGRALANALVLRLASKGLTS